MSRTLILALLALGVLTVAPGLASAATFTPASGAALATALATAGSNNEDDTITLAGPSTLSVANGFDYGPGPSDTDNTLTLEGAGRTITGTGATTDVLDIASGRATIRDLTLNGVATTTNVLRLGAPTALENVTVGGVVAVGNTSGVLVTKDVDATNLTVAVSAQQGVQMDGGTSIIRRSTVRSATTRMINVSTATVTVEDSILGLPAGAGGNGVEAGSPTSNVTVRRTRISGMLSGVVAGFGGLVLVSDSLIVNPQAGGIGVVVDDSGNSTPFNSRATVERTTIVGTNQASQVGVRAEGGTAAEQDTMQAVVRDSVISGFATALSCAEGNAQSVNSITVQRSVLPPGTTDVNTCADFLQAGITLSAVTRVDPQFVNAPAGDYRPAPGSPLIDASLDAAGLPGLPATDFGGSPRLVDGNADCSAKLDIGAFEFQAPVAPQCLPVAPGAGPPATAAPARDTTAPAISALKVARTIRRSSARTPPVTIRFRLSEAATAKLTFQRAKGRRFVPLKGTITLRLKAGAQRVRFAGRISKALSLRPGGYRVTLTATDAAGNRSKAARAPFRLTGSRG